MPTIIRAEYLAYFNPSRTGDKLFYVFVLRADDGTYTCLTENGRRGSNLVRRTVCENVRRETAEGKFWEKVREKRNHRSTPYTTETFGGTGSQIALQYPFNSPTNDSIKKDEPKPTESKTNVIVFPVEKTQKQNPKPKSGGIFNNEQFDSLEF